MTTNADPIASTADPVVVATKRLRAAGLRATAPRVAVLAEVAGGPHLTVEQIAAGARLRLGAISTQAVYDALGALTGVGLMRRIEPAGSPTRYETRVGDNHPPRGLPLVRGDRRRRLRGGRCALPVAVRLRRLRDRRGRRHLLGPAPDCQTPSIPQEQESAR